MESGEKQRQRHHTPTGGEETFAGAGKSSAAFPFRDGLPVMGVQNEFGEG
jgi:hypothetical protein